MARHRASGATSSPSPAWRTVSRAEAAQAEVDALMAQLVEEYPEANRGYTAELLNLRHDIPDARNKIFFNLMQAALLFVLLIACANIANLLLARSQAREREIAIRASIGANRRRIIFQLFTESMPDGLDRPGSSARRWASPA